MERQDDYQRRREELRDLSEEELDRKFWSLAAKIVDPLIELAEENTSPSIERSVLLRMGFNSLEARELVSGIEERQLLGRGAGHIILWVAKNKDLEIQEAGKALLEGRYWEEVEKHFRGS